MMKLWLMRVGVPLCSRFPWLFSALAWVTAWMSWRFRRSAREKVIRNLIPLCDGDEERARKASLRVFRNVGRYYVDLGTLPRRDIANLERDHLRLVHGERLAALETRQPTIVLSAHTGNPELAVQALTYRGRPFVALVEALRPRELSKYLLKLRSSAGGRFYQADFRGVRACLDALKEGGLVALIGDRDIQHSGVCVELCGQHVRLPRGPYDLARRTGAQVIPIFCLRDGDGGFAVFVEEPFCVPATDDEEGDLRRAAKRFAVLLEEHLRRDPGQWAVLEDYWRAHACGEG